MDLFSLRNLRKKISFSYISYPSYFSMESPYFEDPDNSITANLISATLNFWGSCSFFNFEIPDNCITSNLISTVSTL